MAPTNTPAEGTAYIEGRGIDRARRLLEIAEELGLEPGVVRATSFGYTVPTEVAQAYSDAPVAVTSTEPASSQLDGNAVTSTEPEAGGEQTEPSEDGEQTEGESTEEGGTTEETQPEPPRAGAGSSTQAWSDWAAAVHGYNPEEGLTRDELIAKYGASSTE